MMKDLYETLGVPRDATREHIRAVYRSRSKVMHPDVGGDAAAFAALSQAHEVLIDPDRRAHYDVTGMIKSGVDNSGGYILEAIDRAFSAVAMKLAQQNCKDMNVIDMLQQMRLHLGAEETRLRDITKAFAGEITMVEELVTRFSVADGGENFVGKLMETKLRTLHEHAEQPAMELAATVGAIEELKRYTFERKFVPPPVQQPWGATSLGSPYVGSLGATR